jgi:hypothetical protein
VSPEGTIGSRISCDDGTFTIVMNGATGATGQTGATGATAAAGLGIGAVKAGSTLKDVATGDMGKENGEGY